ncbi:MAG: hypothetical protein WD492_17955 [Alkalispirochaeta sp.]
MGGSIFRRVAVPALAMSVIVSITGCSNLLTGNMFSNFDGPPSASDLTSRFGDDNGNVSTEDANDFVNELDDAAGSSRFFDDLSDGDRTDLASSLESVYLNDGADGPDTETRQRAAVLAADVTLRGADSGETINNVANVLTSSDGPESFSDPAQLMDQIIPAGARNDSKAIQRILDDMVTAAGAYDALGASLKDEDDDGAVDGPEGTNMAEVAQKAAVAMVVRNIVEQDSEGSKDLAERIAFGTVGDISYDDPLSSEQDKDGGAFNNILTAGGLGGFFESDA